MNIFVLDENPILAARFQCDKHVVKMVTETAQLLCNAVWFRDKDIAVPYRPGVWKYHPCTKWAMHCLENFEWLYRHGQALAGEYTYRYGKIHKAAAAINFCAEHAGLFELRGGSPHPQCMPDKYKQDDAIEAYRAYYLGDKVRFAKWANGREEPHWWNNDNRTQRLSQSVTVR